MPRVLCDMDNLVDLRLGRNGITSLMRGETIQTTLDNGQVITMVVETFVLMSALRKLTVAMNELSDLPPDIWDVKLDHLNLRNNEIEVRHAAPFPLRLSSVPPKSDAMCWRVQGELPVEIVKLKETLVELYLDENALTALPPCLTDFPLLTRLTVNGNKLTMLPKMPPQLEELLAAGNDLDFLPDGLYQPKRREENHTKLSILDVRGNSRLAYPPPSYLLRGEEIGEYLEKLADPDISINPVTGLRVVEESRNHVELDSYGNEIKASSHVDESKMSSKEERLRRTFAAIDEDDSGVIERKEFRRLMKRLAPQMDKEEVDTVFDEIDTDGGGDLDFEEFSGWWDSDIGKAFRQEQRDVRGAHARLCTSCLVHTPSFRLTRGVWTHPWDLLQTTVYRKSPSSDSRTLPANLVSVFAEAEEAAAEEEANGDTPADGAASPAGADIPGSPGSPWTPDRVAQWVANGGDINAAPANILEAAGIDVPHYREYGKIDSTLLAAAKQEKTAPLKYQEKRALIKAQRKLEAEQAQARAEAEARGYVAADGATQRSVAKNGALRHDIPLSGLDSEDVSEMKTPEEIAAELEVGHQRTLSTRTFRMCKPFLKLARMIA